MNYERIYKYRFQDVNQEKKRITWSSISEFIYQKLGKPDRILDPASGLCEFINSVPSKEKWAVDLNEAFINAHAAEDVKKVVGNSLEVELPQNYFDGVFVSNFLEHLHSQEEVALFLERMHSFLKPGGRIAIIGPNFKYTSRQYFDFADHTVILSELGVSEHLYGAGFNKITTVPKFLPLSFRGNLPVNKFLVETYLKVPLFWKILGKQFLVIAEK